MTLPLPVFFASSALCIAPIATVAVAVPGVFAGLRRAPAGPGPGRFSGPGPLLKGLKTAICLLGLKIAMVVFVPLLAPATLCLFELQDFLSVILLELTDWCPCLVTIH